MRTSEVGTGNVCLPPSWWLWNEPTMESPHPPLYCPALYWTGEGSREAVLAERSDTAETHPQGDQGAFRSCSNSVHVQGPPTPHLLWPVAPHSSHAHISSFLHQARERTHPWYSSGALPFTAPRRQHQRGCSGHSWAAHSALKAEHPWQPWVSHPLLQYCQLGANGCWCGSHP